MYFIKKKKEIEPSQKQTKKAENNSIKI